MELKVQAGHLRQVSEDTAPKMVLNDDAGQRMQASRLPSENVPEGQVEHEVCPTDCPNVPAGQFKQDASEVEPSWLLNVPAGHLVHAADPAVENVPLGHVTQAEALVEPGSLEKVPAGHCVQELELI